MTNLKNEIMDNYQIRKSYKDKSRFIEFISKYFNEKNIHYEVEGYEDFFKSRNIVIGDLKEAQIIFTAHYDTCARIPFPNFITPKNKLIYALYSIFLGVIMVFFALIVRDIVRFLTLSDILSKVSYIFVVLFFLYMILFGKANKHTANDNTSGVVALLSIIDKLNDEERKKCAFVFFDNEEIGLIGSGKLKKKYNDVIKNKLLINFDCVSDGDYMMFVFDKTSNYSPLSEEIKKLCEDLKIKYSKEVLFETTKTAFYPSDQIHFNNTIAVAGLNKSKIFGYYMDKIHTKKDLVFKEENIEFLVDIMTNLIKNKAH